MAGITAAQADAELALWLAADAALAGGAQSYTIKDRTLTRADAGEVRRNVDYWNVLATRLGRTRSRTRYAVPE